MTASMAKRVADLEAAYWAKAEIIRLPAGDEAMKYTKTIYPFETPIFNAWFNSDGEGRKLIRHSQQIEKQLPPIHPAFLPDYLPITRGFQWGLHHRPDYRELLEATYRRFLEHSRFYYDVSDGGLLGVALRLYEKEIDKWMVQREYIGRPTSREELANNQIELYKVFEGKVDKADDPQDKALLDRLWRESLIESVFKLWGRQMTEADLELDQKMWAQLDADMAAGVPASESEAAAYLRDLFDRYPHKVLSSSAD